MPFFLSRRIKLAAVGASLAVAASGAAQASPSHPTIRALLGAAPIERIDPRTTAVVIIDFQKEYFSGALPIPEGQRALENAQKLAAFADAAHMPVIQVQHVAPAGSPVFAIDGETVAFQPGMTPRTQDIVVRKQAVSVFAGTDLDQRLKAMHVKTLIIAGLMTHACVAGAARDAVPLGYQVIVASDASATRDIVRANGQTVTRDALHASALAEIEDTFGDVMTTAEITQLAIR